MYMHMHMTIDAAACTRDCHGNLMRKEGDKMPAALRNRNCPQ